MFYNIDPYPYTEFCEKYFFFKMLKIRNAPKLVKTIYKTICATLCIFLFLFLMKKVIEKYYEATTTTGIKFRNEELLQLPCITFCPIKAFKQRGLYFEEKSYLENTFQLEEIFHDYTLKHISNETNFQIRKINTLFLGTCFTLCSFKYFATKEPIIINFRYQDDIKLFAHEQGEEFWLLASFTFPAEVGNVKLNIKEDSNIVIASMAIKKTETVFLNQEHSPCVQALENENIQQAYNKFLDCSKDKIWQNIQQHANCSIFEFDTFCNHSLLPKCDGESSAAKAFEVLHSGMMDFVSDPAKFGCPMPCRRTSYSLNTVYIHRNSWFNPTNMSLIMNKEFALVYYFESLRVEERIETLVILCYLVLKSSASKKYN